MRDELKRGSISEFTVVGDKVKTEIHQKDRIRDAESTPHYVIRWVTGGEFQFLKLLYPATGSSALLRLSASALTVTASGQLT
jgi:hypothetical protein